MKKLVYLILLFSPITFFSQNSGITYQAVIYLPGGQNAPGVNVVNAPMVNRNICLQFSFIDSNNTIEYREEVRVRTDAFGMVNILIGQGEQNAGYANNFSSIIWNPSFPKKLRVELDASGLCGQFEEISNETISYVPFANAAITAGNVSGVVAIQNGGTGANNINDAKINLELGNVDNTSDANKPISVATQLALDTKEALSNKSTAISLGTSDVLYPTQNAVKSYVDSQVASATIPDATNSIKGKIRLTGDLGGTADSPTVPGLAAKENTIISGTTSQYYRGDKTWQTLDKSAVGLNNVDNTSDVNKPISTATQNALDLKAPLASPTFTGTVSGIDKTMVGLSNVDNTSDVNKPISIATQSALDLKENISNKSTNVTTDGTSDVKFPSVKAVKDYVDNQIATGVVDATNSIKGKIRLTGDLGGTADSPTVPGLATKENTIISGTTSQYYRGDKTWQTLDKSAVGLNNVDNTSDVNKPISTATQNALDLKAPLASPTFTGTVSGIDKTMVGLNNVDNTSDVNKPISIATQSALDLKENISNKSTNVTTDGTSDVKFPSVKAVKDYVDNQIATGVVDATNLIKGKIRLTGDLGGTADSPTVPGLATKENTIISGTTSQYYRGDKTWQTLDKSAVGLNNVDNTSDVNKPISSATQNALDLKAPLASPTFTGTVSGIDKTMVGLNNVDNTSDVNKPISTATQNALDLKAPLASPTFTGTVSGIDKTMVGLSNVDNTSDVNKPISSATQNALDLKAPLASPTFTGTVSGIDKTMVGLSNVDNTSDINKPISSATQSALDLKENISNKSTDINADASSDDKYPSVKAIKNYVDILNAAAGVADGSITSIKIADGTIVNADVATNAAIDYSKLNLANSIITSDLASNSVTSTKIKDGEILNEDISASAAISDTKLATISTSGKVSNSATTATDANTASTIVARDANGNFIAGIITADLNGNAATVTTNANLTGPITSVGNATSITDGAITNVKLDKINIPLSGFGAAIADVALGGKKLTGVADPSSAQDAATKNYVDIVVAAATIADADATTKGKLQLAGDLTGSADAPEIASNAVTSVKILDGTILTADIADSAVTSAKINNGAITADKLFANAVTTEKITDANVTEVKLASDAVTSAKIKDGEIVNADISATAAIQFSKLAISKSDIVGLGIPSSDTDTTYSAGTGVTLSGTTFSIGQDVATTATPTFAKVNKVTITAPTTGATLTIADGKTLTANDNATVSGTNTGDQTITLTGDVTGSGTGSFAATIGTGKVTTATIADGNVTTGKLADAAVTTVKIADGNITDVKLASDAVTSAKIKDGEIVNADISASAAIVDTKLATISTSGKVSNSATTATNVNTASAIVARDSSGNFAAGTITASLSGNATSATTATHLDGGVAGSIPYQTAAATTAMLARGADGQVLTLAGGVPTWSSGVSTITSKTASYTLTTSDNYVIASSGSGITFTLPTAIGNTGKEFTIKNISSNSITLTTTSSQRIIVDAANNTATSVTLGIEASNNWIRVISDGTQWIAFRALF